MTQLNLSIVVPSRGDIRRLQSFLQALRNSTASVQGLELIIVVNGSHDQTEIRNLKSQALFPAKWIFQDAAHVNSARNLGLTKTSKNFILLLDDDCHIPGPDFWETTQCLINNAPDMAHGGCYSLPRKSSWVDQAYWLISNSWLQTWGRSESPFVVGGLILLPKKAVQNKVQFNKKISFGSSELDFADRLRNAQIPVLFHPQWNVIHQSKISLREFLIKALKQGKGAKEAIRFHNSPLHSKHKEIEEKKRELTKTFFVAKRPLFHFLFYAYRKMYAIGHWSSDEAANYALKNPIRLIIYAFLGRPLKIRKRETPLGDIIPKTLFPIPPLVPLTETIPISVSYKIPDLPFVATECPIEYNKPFGPEPLYISKSFYRKQSLREKLLWRKMDLQILRNRFNLWLLGFNLNSRYLGPFEKYYFSLLFKFHYHFLKARQPSYDRRRLDKLKYNHAKKEAQKRQLIEQMKNLPKIYEKIIQAEKKLRLQTEISRIIADKKSLGEKVLNKNQQLLEKEKTVLKNAHRKRRREEALKVKSSLLIRFQYQIALNRTAELRRKEVLQEKKRRERRELLREILRYDV